MDDLAVTRYQFFAVVWHMSVSLDVHVVKVISTAVTGHEIRRRH